MVGSAILRGIDSRLGANVGRRINMDLSVDPKMERLLIPGWAGALTLIEAEYIASQLAINAKLRRLWKIRKRKRYPLQLIAERAFPQDPTEGRRLVENLLAARSHARTLNAD